MAQLLRSRLASQFFKNATPQIRKFSVANVLLKLRAELIADDKQTEELRISWNNKRVSRFPYVFLRDNCPCPKCYHPTSGQSLVLLKDALADASAGISSVSLVDSDVSLKWTCGHESSFKVSWLQERGFYGDAIEAKRQHPIQGLRRTFWGSEHTENIRFFEFADVVEKDEILCEWIKTLATLGLSVLKNAPQECDQLRLLGKRASCGLLNTMYG